MDRMLYIGMSGAKETLLAQSLNNHNLANVSTTGFRADLAQARSMPVFGPGLPSRAYALTERPGIDFTPGPIQTTGRDLDVAIRGQGFIAVQAPDGSEAYTRAGDLSVSPEGLLVTGTGLPVLGEGGPIAVPPAQSISIGTDGAITVVPLGQAANTQAVVDRIKLVNPPLAELEKGEDGLLRGPGGQTYPADAAVTLVSGALEGSNVSPAQALVRMIELSRQFELQVKAMKTAEENDQRTAQLMRLS